MTDNALPTPVISVLEQLQRWGWQAYVVGGCVRDRLLARPVHDYDVATDAPPDEVQRRFGRALPTGVRHGTVTVIEQGMPVEVTTFRIDLGYSDGRRPDAVQFTDHLESDLARRDFTINAMAMDRLGRLIDPFGGLHDLQAGRLRAVGDPDERLCEDALRILRAVRFAAELGFTIDDGLQAAMCRQADGLSRVAGERVGTEWARIADCAWWRICALVAALPLLAALPAPWQDLHGGFRRLADAEWPRREWSAMAAWMDAVQAGAEDAHARALFRTLPPRVALSLAAWCRAASAPPETARQVARCSAWPSAIGQIAADMLDFCRNDPLRWPDGAWREALFARPAWSLAGACLLLDEGVGTRVHLHRHQAATLPIRSLRDLAITGADVTALGESGPLVGEILRQLAADVLDGSLDNSKDALLARAASLVTAAHGTEGRSSSGGT